MIRFFCLSTLLLFPIFTQAQTDSLPDMSMSAYFSAIIVSDMEASTQWYTDVLGMTVLNHFESAERGVKQTNLQRGDILIELIELDAAVSPLEAIPHYNPKTRLIGLFKIGFRVSDFDAWMMHLRQKEVEFHGDVVTDPVSGKRMIIIRDPDGNRIQMFER